MPDLSDDALARIELEYRRHSTPTRSELDDSYVLQPHLVEEIRRLRADLAAARAERDAAVAEAVLQERERCLAILGSNKFWDSVEDAIRRGE